MAPESQIILSGCVLNIIIALVLFLIILFFNVFLEYVVVVKNKKRALMDHDLTEKERKRSYNKLENIKQSLNKVGESSAKVLFIILVSNALIGVVIAVSELLMKYTQN